MTQRLSLLVLLVLSSAASAGEVLQLPSYSFTTVNTTVTAPDGGTAFLGGVSRLSEGATTRGVPILNKVPGLNRLFKNRGIGRTTQSLDMTVVPRIIILEEEEERQVGRVLAERRAVAGAPVPPPYALNEVYRRRAEFLAQHVAQHQPADYRGAQAPAVEVDPYAELRAVQAKNELAAIERDREALENYERGQAAEAEGRKGAARIYYQIALKRAKGQFRDEIQARLDALESGGK
jgi:hypothetical protein